MKQFLVGLGVALLLAASMGLWGGPAPVQGSPQTTDPLTGSGKWATYDLRESNPWHDEGSLPLTIKVWARCLMAEDSAAHLRLRKIDNDRMVYGCYREGY